MACALFRELMTRLRPSVLWSQSHAVRLVPAHDATSGLAQDRLCCWYRYSTNADNKKSFLTGQGTRRDLIEGVIKERKQHFEAKKNQLKESGQIILKDIKKTTSGMKERMEEVIEVCFRSAMFLLQ